MFDLKCITKKASFFSALPSLEFSKRIYEPIPSHCLLLICCACTDNKNPRNSTRSATGAIREEQKSKRPKVCSDLRMMPEIRGATMYRPDGRIIVFLHHHRQIFVVSSLELATPKATPVESHPHRRTRGKLCRFASYSNEEFEHSFNSSAGRLKVGRDWEAEYEERDLIVRSPIAISSFRLDLRLLCCRSIGNENREWWWKKKIKKEEKPLNASRTGFASKRNGKLNEGIRFYLFYSWNN